MKHKIFTLIFFVALTIMMLLGKECSAQATSMLLGKECSAQATSNKKDTLSIPMNQLQMSIITDKEKKITEARQKLLEVEKEYTNSLELILGVKQEDIESLQFRNGAFKITKKLNQKN